MAPLDVKVSFHPNMTQLRPKDHIEESKMTYAVYQIPCAVCPATYVRQTDRCLNQQLKEYRHAMESANSASSALAEHAWNAHHAVDWDRMKMFDHQPKLHQRLG